MSVRKIIVKTITLNERSNIIYERFSIAMDVMSMIYYYNFVILSVSCILYIHAITQDLI